LAPKGIKVSKTAEFHPDFKSVEKDLQKCTKKIISNTSFTNMSKSGNSAYFRHETAQQNGKPFFINMS
jgi:hypothetical protein